jgi:hypothetical protein
MSIMVGALLGVLTGFGALGAMSSLILGCMMVCIDPKRPLGWVLLAAPMALVGAALAWVPA